MAELKQEPEVIFEYCVLCSQNFPDDQESFLDEEDIFESARDCFSILFPPDIYGAVCPSCRRRLSQARRLKRFISDTLIKLNNGNTSRPEVGPSEEKSPYDVPHHVVAIKSEPSRQAHIQYFPCGDNDKKNDSTLNNLETCHSENKRIRCNVCSKDFSSRHVFKKHMAYHRDARDYKCSICFKTLKTRIGLKNHAVIHSDQRNFICDICSRDFKSKSSLKYHLTWHNKKRIYKCDVCDKAFKSNLCLTKHMVRHNSKMDLKCSYCPEVFKTKKLLKSHITVHGEKNECSVCWRVFVLACNLRKHMSKHRDERVFKCSVCPKAYKTKICLDKHTVSHINKNYKCSVCSKAFKSKIHIKLHMLCHSNESNYKCSACYKTFRTNDGLKTHMASHSDEQNSLCEHKLVGSETSIDKNSTGHCDIRNFKCYICPKEFELESDFKEHANSHPNLNVRVNLTRLEYLDSVAARVLDDGLTYILKSADVVSEKQTRPVSISETNQRPKCAVCSELFSSKDTLENHMSAVHGDSEQSEPSRKVQDLSCGDSEFKPDDENTKNNRRKRKEKFICNVCSREFSTKHSRKFHMAYHDEEYKHKCNVCLKAFKSINNLRSHVITHSKERNFKCSVCSKALKSKYTLKHHMSRHSDKTKDIDAVSVPKPSNITLYYGSIQKSTAPTEKTNVIFVLKNSNASAV